MAKTYEDEDGVWRTIGGRRVFIRSGQSLSEAMKESGKFSNLYKSEKKSENKEEKGIEKDEKMEKAGIKTAKDLPKLPENLTKYLDTHKGMDKFPTTIKDGDRWFSITQEEKDMLKNYVDKVDSIPEETWRKWDEKEALDISNRANNAERVLRNSVVDKEQFEVGDFKKKAMETLPKEDEKNVAKSDITDFKHQITQDESDYYNNLSPNEVYELGMKLTEQRALDERQMNIKDEANKLLDGIDRANKKGSGYADKQTEKLRELLKSSKDMLGKEELNKSNVEPVEDRLVNNMIVSHYADDVAYRDKNNNLWVTSREQYNDYVNGKKDKMGAELVFSDEDALKTMIASEGLNRFPYEGYVADEKSGNDKKYKKFVDSEFERLKGTIEDSTNARAERAKTNPNYAKFKEEKNEGLNEDGSFTQHLDMHGGTREYTAEEMKAMQDRGIKPLEHSYTGGGWEGVNSDKPMDTKDQAKAITDAMKKKYPDVKISRRSELYSGGSSIHFSVMESAKDLYLTDKDIDKMDYSDFGSLTGSSGFEWWAKENVKDYDKTHSYNIDDVRKYAKTRLEAIKTGENQSVRGSEWYLSDYGKKVMSDLNKEANSYTYSDSDGMVDYFDHGTYMWVNIGKYDKPYQVNQKENNINSSLRRKGYEKYMKEHPGSKMTFEEYQNKK